MANVAEDLKDRSDPLELVVVGADIDIQAAGGGLRDAAPDGSVDHHRLAIGFPMCPGPRKAILDMAAHIPSGAGPATGAAPARMVSMVSRSAAESWMLAARVRAAS